MEGKYRDIRDFIKFKSPREIPLGLGPETEQGCEEGENNTTHSTIDLSRDNTEEDPDKDSTEDASRPQET